jgi:hypothetical protein
LIVVIITFANILFSLFCFLFNSLVRNMSFRSVQSIQYDAEAFDLFATCFISGGFYRGAEGVLSSLSILFPTRFRIASYNHTSSPFCWISSDMNQTPNPNEIVESIGGHDDTICLLS